MDHAALQHLTFEKNPSISESVQFKAVMFRGNRESLSLQSPPGLTSGWRHPETLPPQAGFPPAGLCTRCFLPPACPAWPLLTFLVCLMSSSKRPLLTTLLKVASFLTLPPPANQQPDCCFQAHSQTCLSYVSPQQNVGSLKARIVFVYCYIPRAWTSPVRCR